MLSGSCQRFAFRALGLRSFQVCSVQQLPSARQQQLQQHAQGANGGSLVRQYADKAGDDYMEEVDAINEKFAEAREEIEYAREDAETVYFNESAEEARKAVSDVFGRWEALLSKVSQEDQAKLQRSMGLKIEQLKAELKELDQLHA